MVGRCGSNAHLTLRMDRMDFLDPTNPVQYDRLPARCKERGRLYLQHPKPSFARAFLEDFSAEQNAYQLTAINRTWNTRSCGR